MPGENSQPRKNGASGLARLASHWRSAASGKPHVGHAGGAASAAAAPVVLGATEADEWLPVADDFPADVFTACLTRPLETALQLAMRSSLRRASGGPPPPAAQLLAALPGSLGDRRSPLGELTWVLPAITDSIGWQLLPPALFRRLFRQDVLLSALLRNFVLASRVMHTLHCSVVPHLPERVVVHRRQRRGGTPIAVAYDRDHNTHLPCLRGGKAAHWAVIRGYCWARDGGGEDGGGGGLSEMSLCGLWLPY